MLEASIESSWELLKTQYDYCHQIEALEQQSRSLKEKMNSHQQDFDRRYAVQLGKLREAKRKQTEAEDLSEMMQHSLRCEMTRLRISQTADWQQMTVRYKQDLYQLERESLADKHRAQQEMNLLQQRMFEMEGEFEMKQDESNIKMARLEAEYTSVKAENDKQLTEHKQQSSRKLGPVGRFFMRASVALATAVPTTLAGFSAAGPIGAVVGAVAGLVIGAGTQILAGIAEQSKSEKS